jgi:hypothetical protein
LECKFCNKNFDTNQRVPRMLYTCGHSICFLCLKNFIETKEYFICAEDDVRISLNGLSIEKFPPNVVLLKILEDTQDKKGFQQSLAGARDQPQKRATAPSEISKHTGPQSHQLQARVVEFDNLSLTSDSRTVSNKFKNEFKRFPGDNIYTDKKKISDFETLNNQGRIPAKVNEIDMCRVHGKPYEAVCTKKECGIRVCLVCGVFGDHVVRLIESFDSKGRRFSPLGRRSINKSV